MNVCYTAVLEILCLLHKQVFNQSLCNVSMLLFVCVSGDMIILTAIASIYLESTLSTSKKLLVSCHVSAMFLMCKALLHKNLYNFKTIEDSYLFYCYYFSDTLLLMNECIR